MESPAPDIGGGELQRRRRAIEDACVNLHSIAEERRRIRSVGRNHSVRRAGDLDPGTDRHCDVRQAIGTAGERHSTRATIECVCLQLRAEADVDLAE